jgi:hypothetical protein
MVDIRGHFDVLCKGGLNVRIDIVDDVIVVFGVVEMVRIGHPPELARGRHVGLAREHFASILGGVDDQGGVTMAPIADLFAVV